MPLWRVLHHQRLEHAQESGQSCARLAARGRQLHRARRPTRRAPRNSDGIHLHPEIPAGQRCRGHGRRHRAPGRSRLRRRAGGHWPAGPPGAGIHARGAQRRGRGRQRAGRCTPRLARRPADRGCAGPGRPDRRGRDRRRVAAGHAQADAGVSGQLPVPVHEGTTSLWHLADLLGGCAPGATPPGRPRWRKWRGPPCRSTWPRKGAGPPPEAPFRARRATAVPGRRARHRARG